MQADRLLREMHKLCCHDLPNQIVVAQTLLQLFLDDETQRLDAEGVESLQRLTRLLAGAASMTRVLRELVKLADQESKPELLDWKLLARDWRAKIAERFAGRDISLQTFWDVPSARGVANAITGAILEFLSISIAEGTEPVIVKACTEQRADGVQLTCEVIGACQGDSPPLKTRIEWLLIRNLVTQSGGVIETSEVKNASARFVVIMP